jgi:hypothetical protein
MVLIGIERPYFNHREDLQLVVESQWLRKMITADLNALFVATQERFNAPHIFFLFMPPHTHGAFLLQIFKILVKYTTRAKVCSFTTRIRKNL